MKQLWYRCCHWLGARIYFERITVLHRERLPGGGPVLYVVLHRNGAVDGLVYRQVLPRAVPVISTQLRRSFFARLFFCGIAVARTKDAEDGNQNQEALRECVRCLADGGELIVFPEGTSSLGPRHLPFKSGAARIALEVLGRGVPLRIVPAGIHYERAWAFRSKVEVVMGEPISTDLPADLSEQGRLKEMKRRMTTALEAVGANFASAEAQETAQRLAYAATLGTPRSYFSMLKSLEAGVPEPLLASWGELEPQFAARRMLLHQGVPLFPVGPWLLSALLLLGLGPVVLAGALANFPPLFLGWLAARKFADDLNVIALWRLLVGLPLFVIWFGAVSVPLALFAGGWWLLGYVLLTFAALKSLYRAKKLAVAVWNGLMHRDLARRAHEFHQLVSAVLILARSAAVSSRPAAACPDNIKLLPHEWFFGAFLLVTWVRLVTAVGPLDPNALLYLVLLLVNAAVIVRCELRETRARWFARLWYYPVAMNVAFMTMGSTALKVVRHRQDAVLQQIDAVLVGVTPSLSAQALVAPWLTETLSFCYVLFFPYLFISLVLYAWRGVPAFRQLCVGLFTIYAVGFLGYSTVPAAGPHLAMPGQFSVPLTGWAITRFNAFVVARGSNGVDVFPSLHCAVSCFLLFFDRQHARWRFRLYAVPCVGLWLATIYLRYHYLVDVIAGFALAAFALWVTRNWEKCALKHQPETEP